MTDELATITVTPDQMALITRTIAPDATPDELKLYLFDCARQNVHPLDRLLHFTKRSGRYAPVTSIDLMRIRASETGECIGISDALFTGPGTAGVYPSAATVTVRRLVQGQAAEFTATARWIEFYPGDGPSGFFWRKMPHVMLGKVAEAAALRKGFPKQLSGLYEAAELDQADRGEPAPAPKAAKPEPTAPPAATPAGKRQAAPAKGKIPEPPPLTDADIPF